MRKSTAFLLLATLTLAALLPAGSTSASAYNYLVFTDISLDCATGAASGSIAYNLQPGAKVVADATVHSDAAGDTTVHQEDVATEVQVGTKTETWANASAAANGGVAVPFPPDGYLHVVVKVYAPDGTQAGETEAYGECPSGTTWIAGWGMPGADSFIEYTPWAVGGTFTQDALLYAKPGKATVPAVVLPEGKSVMVLGLDASGQYYKIVFAARYLWVKTDVIGPNFDAVWRGTPLPTQVVD